MRSYQSVIICLLLSCFIISCNQDVKRDPSKHIEGSLFTQIPITNSKVSFQNNITESPQFNFLNYSYIYNGGGVAVGDINNDGLEDVYFTANQGENKLYLNKGDMVFEDISTKAGVVDANGWSTGVSMIDINNDGYLDIYICKSGSLQDPEARRNKLFINNGNLSFVEKAAEYGLNDPAYSTQAYFLDIENDGDLDVYLVNHRPDFNNNSKINSEIQRAKSMESSDHLYRNDNGKFSRITREAGLLNKTWGLSAAIADYNNDGFADIYVCNDFLEPDHLYINQKNGSFKDEIRSYMKHISFYSMGSDIADINNDGELDLVVLDMVPEDHVRSKRNMASMSNSTFWTMVNVGYHHQYMANMLQLNNGNGTFSEIGHMAGISKTDWSWAPLLADFDNDGFKDLYVTNGIRRDVTDNDYKIELRKRNQEGTSMTLEEIFNLVPSQKSVNYSFRNNGNLGFEKVSTDWGLNQSLHSNGAAYSDLDNDGDLDLVVNNIDDYASIYQNQSVNNFIQIDVQGPPSNLGAIGTKITITTGSQKQTQEVYYNRGFQSSMASRIHFGLSDHQMVDVEIQWPDENTSFLTGVKANQILSLDYNQVSKTKEASERSKSLFAQINPGNLGIQNRHQENDYDDFIKEILLPQKQSTLGPGIDVGDVNGDGLEDLFVGGAKDQPSHLYLQNKNGYTEDTPVALLGDEKYEDVGALFFDADGDNDLDLYVASGGNESPQGDPLYIDRLYINDGKGEFIRKRKALPSLAISTKTIKASDIDKDGDLDLFVGGRQIPGQYPYPADSYILINTDGRFTDKTTELAPDFEKLGMVTDAIFSDFDNDQDEDLIIVGEWMELSFYKNTNGQFDPHEDTGLEKTSGWWYGIDQGDFDNDGDLDYVLGNLGLNNKFGPKPEKPFHVYCDDFDENGTYDIVLSKEGGNKLLPVRGRECSSQQMPFITEKFPTYKQFAEANLVEIYGEKLNTALHYEVYTFASSYLENLGNGRFQKKKLPREAQFGPSLSFVVEDLNNDGNLDLIGVGNIHESEVETVRYDASRGYVLIGDGNGEFEPASFSGFYNHHNAKAIRRTQIGTDKVYIVANNNGPLTFIKAL